MGFPHFSFNVYKNINSEKLPFNFLNLNLKFILKNMYQIQEFKKEKFKFTSGILTF